MITLRNGHSFEYMAASGSLAFDGKGWLWEQPLRWAGLLDPSLFTVVTKTLTLHPRKGNLRWYWPYGCVRFIPGGTLNAVALTNPGIRWWCGNVGPKVDRMKIPLGVSILGEPDELVQMVWMLEGYDVLFLEILVSCPNIGDDLWANSGKAIESCRRVRQETDLPLILKLSVANDVDEIVPAVQGIVDAFSINSVPWRIAFPEQRSPLERFGGGGVSGKAAQPYTWPLLRKLTRMSDIPVIGPSVWDYGDIAGVRKLGAGAIGIGSAALRYPWRPTLFVRRDQKERR